MFLLTMSGNIANLFFFSIMKYLHWYKIKNCYILSYNLKPTVYCYIIC